jgi:uncharacterized membrane protein YphA (DoxX/SURF4 family)
MVALYILAFCRVVTGLAFAFSSLSKARDFPRFRQTIMHFGLLPERLSGLAALLVLGGEFVVVLFVAIGGPFLLAGFLLAALLLLVFCTALTSVLVRLPLRNVRGIVVMNLSRSSVSSPSSV